MPDIDLILSEFKYFSTWEALIRATLDGWGLTVTAVNGVKKLPTTIEEINNLVETVRTIRERVDWLKGHVPPVVTPDDQWDVMRAGADLLWYQYTIPTEPEGTNG